MKMNLIVKFRGIILNIVVVMIRINKIATKHIMIVAVYVIHNHRYWKILFQI